MIYPSKFYETANTGIFGDPYGKLMEKQGDCTPVFLSPATGRENPPKDAENGSYEKNG
jgi:hypothetical protein